MKPTFTLTLTTDIEQAFKGYDSLSFIKNSSHDVIFSMATYPIFTYYFEKCKKLLEQTDVTQKVLSKEQKVLTLKTTSTAFNAFFLNLFKKQTHTYYLVEKNSRYEIEPSWINIQKSVSLKDYTQVVLDIPNWSKLVYGYRIFTSYCIHVTDII